MAVCVMYDIRENPNDGMKDPSNCIFTRILLLLLLLIIIIIIIIVLY